MSAQRTRRRRGWWLGLVTLALLLVGAPASADPPGPTNFSSEVVGIEPQVDGFAVEVLGGDAFLQIRSDGHDVAVPGYDDEEQYLRFDPDGSVYVNVRSAAYFQNDARYGVATSAIPDDVGPDQPPRWEQVSSDGTWAWHDHRIHWMSPITLPPNVDSTLAQPQSAGTWPLSIYVDGRPVEATGELTWQPDTSPVLAIAGIAIGLLVGLAVLGRRSGPGGIAVLVAVGVMATGVVGLVGAVGLAPGVQAEPLPLVLTVLAAVVAVAGWAVRDRTTAAGVLAGAAGIPLVVWALAHLAAVTAPIVPSVAVPADAVRVVVGLAAGIGVMAVLGGLRDLFTRPLSTTAAVATT